MTKKKTETKKSAPKKGTTKAVIKKTAATKEAAIKKVKKIVKKSPTKASSAVPLKAIKTLPAITSVPCICIKKRNRWFCMKEAEDGTLTQCDGPFATQAECEAHVCI